MNYSKGIPRFLSYLVPVSLAGLVVYAKHYLEFTWGFLHSGITKSIFILLVLLEWVLNVRRRFPQ